MNKDQFFSTDPHSRVKKINKLLESQSLDEVAKSIGIPRSTFSKEMQKEDYVFIKRDNQFYRFVRDEKTFTQNDVYNDQTQNIMEFITEHQRDFEELFKMMKGERVDIDPQIYDDSTKVITKSIRIREHVYQNFQSFCQQQWPQFNIQDLISQALIEFMQKKKNSSNSKVTS